MVIADHVPLPQLIELEGCTVPPDGSQRANFARLLGDLAGDLGPGVRFAMLRTRPGPSRVEELDRAWARAVYDACALAEVVRHRPPRHPGRHPPLPPDEVMSASA